MKINEATKITFATLGKRFLASFIDAVLTIFLGLGVYIGISKIFSNIPSVNEMKVKYFNVINESYILEIKDEESVLKDWKTFDECTSDIYSFYNEYLPKYDDSYETISPYWFNVFVLGLDDEKNQFSSDEMNDRNSVAETGKDLFAYKVEGGNKNYDVIGLPIYQNNGEKSFTDLSETEQNIVLSYFNDTSNEKHSIAYFCIVSMSMLPILNDLYSDYILWQTTIPFIIGIFITVLVFYVVLPLVLKDGKTLGKLIMKISLVSTSYFAIKKHQIVLRTLPQLCLAIIAILFLGINIITVFISTTLSFVSFFMTIFKEKHEALHDKIAMTYVVLDEESIWFKNEAEEAAAIKEVQEIVG